MTHTEEQVRAYYTIIMDNNPNGVIVALNDNGFPTPSTISRQLLGGKLRSIFNSNKDLFFKIMKSVPIRENANNYTTKPALANALLNSADAITKNKHI